MSVGLILTGRRLREWAGADPRLVAIGARLAESIPARYGPLWVTRVWSSKAEEREIELAIEARTGRPYRTSGIHAEPRPYRAVDVDAPAAMPDDEARELERRINAEWQYNPARPSRPCAIYHLGHWHLQVHPATERRTTHGPKRLDA